MTATPELEISEGIVVGYDGSANAHAALRWAGFLAARASLPLHVVRAWQMSTAPRPDTWEPGYIPPVDDYEKAVTDELEDDVARAGLPAGISVTCHAVHRSPAEGLLHAAAHADLLVIGSRGAGGFVGLLLGSVSYKCVHHAKCPVVVVPRTSEFRAMSS